MADRSLAIRLAVIDGGKVKAELRDVGDAGSRSLKRIEDAARPASRALQALDGVAGEVRGNLESMAGRLGPLGAGLVRLGPAGIAAAGAIAGVGLALTRSFQEAAEADRSYRRLEAVLKATGHASGLTAGEIGAFAEAMEASTLVTAEAVQDAASVLATFRSVSGDTFTRALSLAQDLATVFGQDLSATATQLGKALEDPTQGLTALRRVGISFTESERELITSLAETGRTAEAQRLILDALEKQVGGAGAAEAGGLTGATSRCIAHTDASPREGTAARGSPTGGRGTPATGGDVGGIDGVAARGQGYRSAASGALRARRPPTGIRGQAASAWARGNTPWKK
ncbi:MAG: phage tail length tape measure family protein [Defluviicoccus sp.]|nr:phage tail length tape measure family protein [Defluviicoccus sp.]